METLSDLSIKQYLRKLSEKTPAPGGGSAAAVVISSAVALYKMCFEYSRKNFAAAECESLTADINSSLDSAVSLIQKDKDAYLNLAVILKDKNRYDEHASAYKTAALVSLEMIKVCKKMLDIISNTISKIEPVFISDLKSSFKFLKAGFESAQCFADVNLKCLNAEDLRAFKNFEEEEIGNLKSKFERIEKEFKDAC